MAHPATQNSDMRILRAAVLNGVEPPLLVVMRLEAQGLDVSETVVRIRESIGLKAVA